MAPELVRQLTTPVVGEMEQAGFGAPSVVAPATDAMAGGGVKEEEMEREEEEHGLGFVLALPAVAVPLAVLVAFLLRGVPRRARSLLPRASPTGWWGLRLPAPAPEAGRPRRPHRQRARLPSGDDLDDGDAEAPPRKRRRMPAKGGRRCENCGAEETPQWRLSEMGTLCNACGVRLRVNNSLERRERPRKRKAAGPTPAAPTAGTVAEPLPAPPAVTEGAFPEPPPAGTVAEPLPAPPALMEGTFAGPPLAPESPTSESTPAAESPISDSPPYSPDTPMWMRDAEEEEEEEEEVYLVKRKRPKRVQKKKKTPTTQQYKSAPWPPVTDKKCAHCGSSKTPQWRNGPMGRATLCNACGVRCRQGKLFPEYRPAASPTFERSKHANWHRDVLKLRQQQQQGGGDNQHPPPPPEQAQQPADDGLPNLHVDGNGGPADAPLSGGGDGGLTDELQLPQLQQVKEQYPPTPVHQPLPMDSIVDPGASGLINDPADAPANFADLVAGGLNDPANFGGLDGPANFVDPGAGGFNDTANAPANFGGLNDPANAPASFGGDPFDFADLDGLLDGPSASPLHPDFFK